MKTVFFLFSRHKLLCWNQELENLNTFTMKLAQVFKVQQFYPLFLGKKPGLLKNEDGRNVPFELGLPGVELQRCRL